MPDPNRAHTPTPATARPGVVGEPVRRLLRLEGAAVLALCLVLYQGAGYSWPLFLILFLAPDLSFAGYLAGPRIGATCYNLLHSYAGPTLLAVGSVLTGAAPAVALIWAAHVGFDRLLGFGLKYPSAFQDTHLGRIGRDAAR